jgi:hypothetical protein
MMEYHVMMPFGILLHCLILHNSLLNNNIPFFLSIIPAFTDAQLLTSSTHTLWLQADSMKKIFPRFMPSLCVKRARGKAMAMIAAENFDELMGAQLLAAFVKRVYSLSIPSLRDGSIVISHALAKQATCVCLARAHLCADY